MTFQIEEFLTEEEQASQQGGLTVRCSWCGEIIRLDGREHDLAMCQGCYEQMLSEFLRVRQMNNPTSHRSDR